MRLPGHKVSSMLLGKSREQFLIVPVRVKQVGQGGNDPQLWIVAGGESKVRCCKEQYCLGTWNVRSMNQDKLMWPSRRWQDWTSSLRNRWTKWAEMDKFNSDDHYIYYCKQEPLERNGIALIVKESPKCGAWAQSQKEQNDSVAFQGKPFNIRVIQVCAPTTDAKETKADWFCEDLQHSKKWCPFCHRGLKCKSSKSRGSLNNRQDWPWSSKWNRAKANSVLSREHAGHSKHPFPTAQFDFTHGPHHMVNTKIRLIMFFAAKDGEAI